MEAKASRRRSLKALLQIPGKLSRSSIYGSIPLAHNGVGSVPPDIILEIADRLQSADLLNLSLAVCPVLLANGDDLMHLSLSPVVPYTGAAHAGAL